MVKVVSNFCHIESRTEFADTKRYSRTKELEVKVRR